MSRDETKDRDQLDEALARHVRAAKRPAEVPAPSENEPSDDELLRFVEGNASADERARVEEAAARSPYTADRLEILGATRAEDMSLAERLGRYVFVVAKDTLELLRSVTEPVLAPSPAYALRSVSPAVADQTPFFELLHPMGDLDARIRVEHVIRRGRVSLDVQLRLIAREGASLAGARILLSRGSETLDNTPVDDNGAATFTTLEPARYRLEVRRSSQPVGSVILDFVTSAS